MRKLLFSVLTLVVLLGGFKLVSAVTCQSYEYNDNGVCKQIPSTALQNILNSYCKPNTVKYTEWSACDKRFGKNGTQYRSIIYPTLGGCKASTYDQVAQQRECLK